MSSKMTAYMVVPSGSGMDCLSEYMANIVNVVYNRDVKNKMKRFKALQTEAYGDKYSRAFEFIPIKISIEQLDDLLCGPTTFKQQFGFVVDKHYYTNARELGNLGVPIEQWIQYVDFTNYRALKCKAPRMVYNQVQTHTQVTSISFSARFSDNNMGYFKPDEIQISQKQWNDIVHTLSPAMLKAYMKENGVKRKEIFNRGADSLQYVSFSLGGYMNNQNAWNHFIKQRAYDSHTQEETRKFAKIIEEVLQKE